MEKNNIVKGVPTVPAVSREPPKVAQEQPTAAAAEQVSDGLKIALSPKRKVVPVFKRIFSLSGKLSYNSGN